MRLTPPQREALEKLVADHQGRLRAFLARFEADPDVVDETLQEVFIAVIPRAAELSGREVDDAATYLRGVARNLVRLRWRRQSVSRRHSENAAREIARRTMDRDLDDEPGDSAEFLSALKLCVEGLAGHARKLVEGYYFENTTAAELARAARQSAASMRMTLLRIRRQLRTCVEARVPGAKL